MAAPRRQKHKPEKEQTENPEEDSPGEGQDRKSGPGRALHPPTRRLQDKRGEDPALGPAGAPQGHHMEKATREAGAAMLVSETYKPGSVSENRCTQSTTLTGQRRRITQS